ncbi:sensor histidine kinase [Achromobacter insuavis]|uniref:sensor histidine kinase n=1 Tax=Achromobacter insuavis TaxID=1287735 RepID=UPI001F12F7F3|nr:ATP-binding protein [Achromobacter insuavis]
MLAWLALLAAPAMAQPDAADCVARVLEVRSAQAGPGGERPADGPAWRTVSLPDDWDSRWPQYSGAVWYRIDWRHGCGGAPAGQAALAVESIVMAGEIHLNDDLLWRDASLVEPLSRSWNMPRYWRLPQSSVRDGFNTLWIRVTGVAGQTPGLGPVHLGEPEALLRDHEMREWRNRTLFLVNLVISATLGALFFFLWAMQPRQSSHGWYALTALFWVLFCANVLAVSPWPFGTTLMAARANTVALTLHIACFCLFTWRFAGQSWPRLEKALWCAVAVMLAAAIGVPDTAVATMQRVIVLTVSALFYLNCLQFAVHAVRSRDREQMLLAACLVIFLGAALHDLLLILKLIGGLSVIPYTSVAVLVGMSAVLGLRHARGVRRIERFNHELEISVGRARAELATTLAREHELALANSRLQDRLEIARDLHDGLGGSLVRMTAAVEQAGEPLRNRQVLSMLNLLRNDLRQTIDNGASADMTPPATPREWIAPLRHRYTQLFDELDVAVRWDVPGAWDGTPSALQCLALTRLIEEALTNVVKHSRARRVGVTLRQPAHGQLELEIEDDGVGFDVDAVRRANLSVGVRSMATRIARVGGTLDIASAPGCTRLCARLSLPQPASAAIT